mmetsp:Transcript_24729/g.36686  ORF Transcript_24729/g.36686 Transcript_24729/m.36686 type:complete len:394 (-) Transcript_24729:103-1284(-)
MNVNPNHIIFGSEACHCPTTGYAGGDLKVAWARAERYAHTVLADLAAGSNGWIEWNLLLDSIGGPNHLGNLCDAPLLAVPYRAKGAKGVNTTANFEKAGHPFGRVVGDGRTRDELNALGFSALFLDEGIIVQPMYHYMGHISRHVRPGSVAVPAIVDSVKNAKFARTFRRQGRPVAGGGINDLARVGVEVTLWPCEGSTRQEWKFNEDGQFEVFGHDWLGVPTTSCLGKVPDPNFEGLLLTNCDSDAGQFVIVPGPSDHTSVHIQLVNGGGMSVDSCMILKPLENNGGAYGPRGGAQVTIGSCNSVEANWAFDENSGEVRSKFFALKGGEVCMTTGWPFLQVGAFSTPLAPENKAVVVLNEAGESANFVLKDSGKIVLSTSIPAHSIQTILYN